jgi:hypothetical protein
MIASTSSGSRWSCVSGTLKPVFHGTPTVLTLSELVRSYNNLVEDATRVMQRIKAMFRARVIATKGTAIYRPSERAQWLAQLEGGARVRAAALFKQGLARRLPLDSQFRCREM